MMMMMMMMMMMTRCSKNVTAGRAGEELLCGDLPARSEVHHGGRTAHRGESHLDHPLHLRHVSDGQLHDSR